uniref:Uncharacterized protein n=1 Tax=Chromera velia CCMP2878 TaxID=1169474 RepID=A0A0G4I523_9ALVE|eukprot:Cvel_10996.t1-p1 / transcript=Cvel_10996.t1 / gene=Cvel_10996 / organism=Chromera_velia_CCMP2878 / gene_product=hypothetical protein / transcript_product=hypothetical protein / location=Cvel_scaffold677:37828-46244(+) / protein_length=1483 / sequence_SO=supercontig / SO=protein_coding / is_pseudo=false
MASNKSDGGSSSDSSFDVANLDELLKDTEPLKTASSPSMIESLHAEPRRPSAGAAPQQTAAAVPVAAAAGGPRTPTESHTQGTAPPRQKQTEPQHNHQTPSVEQRRDSKVGAPLASPSQPNPAPPQREAQGLTSSDNTLQAKGDRRSGVASPAPTNSPRLTNTTQLQHNPPSSAPGAPSAPAEMLPQQQTNQGDAHVRPAEENVSRRPSLKAEQAKPPPHTPADAPSPSPPYDKTIEDDKSLQNGHSTYTAAAVNQTQGETPQDLPTAGDPELHLTGQSRRNSGVSSSARKVGAAPPAGQAAPPVSRIRPSFSGNNLEGGGENRLLSSGIATGGGGLLHVGGGSRGGVGGVRSGSSASLPLPLSEGVSASPPSAEVLRLRGGPSSSGGAGGQVRVLSAPSIVPTILLPAGPNRTPQGEGEGGGVSVSPDETAGKEKDEQGRLEGGQPGGMADVPGKTAEFGAPQKEVSPETQSDLPGPSSAHPNVHAPDGVPLTLSSLSSAGPSSGEQPAKAIIGITPAPPPQSRDGVPLQSAQEFGVQGAAGDGVTVVMSLTSSASASASGVTSGLSSSSSGGNVASEDTQGGGRTARDLALLTPGGMSSAHTHTHGGTVTPSMAGGPLRTTTAVRPVGGGGGVKVIRPASAAAPSGGGTGAVHPHPPVMSSVSSSSSATDSSSSSSSAMRVRRSENSSSVSSSRPQQTAVRVISGGSDSLEATSSGGSTERPVCPVTNGPKDSAQQQSADAMLNAELLSAPPVAAASGGARSWVSASNDRAPLPAEGKGKEKETTTEICSGHQAEGEAKKGRRRSSGGGGRGLHESSKKQEEENQNEKKVGGEEEGGGETRAVVETEKDEQNMILGDLRGLFLDIAEELRKGVGPSAEGQEGAQGTRGGGVGAAHPIRMVRSMALALSVFSGRLQAAQEQIAHLSVERGERERIARALERQKEANRLRVAAAERRAIEAEAAARRGERYREAFMQCAVLEEEKRSILEETERLQTENKTLKTALEESQREVSALSETRVKLENEQATSEALRTQQKRLVGELTLRKTETARLCRDLAVARKETSALRALTDTLAGSSSSFLNPRGIPWRGTEEIRQRQQRAWRGESGMGRAQRPIVGVVRGRPFRSLSPTLERSPLPTGPFREGARSPPGRGPFQGGGTGGDGIPPGAVALHLENEELLPVGEMTRADPPQQAAALRLSVHDLLAALRLKEIELNAAKLKTAALQATLAQWRGLVTRGQTGGAGPQMLLATQAPPSHDALSPRPPLSPAGALPPAPARSASVSPHRFEKERGEKRAVSPIRSLLSNPSRGFLNRQSPHSQQQRGREMERESVSPSAVEASPDCLSVTPSPLHADGRLSNGIAFSPPPFSRPGGFANPPPSAERTRQTGSTTRSPPGRYGRSAIGSPSIGALSQAPMGECLDTNALDQSGLSVGSLFPEGEDSRGVRGKTAEELFIGKSAKVGEAARKKRLLESLKVRVGLP